MAVHLDLAEVLARPSQPPPGLRRVGEPRAGDRVAIGRAGESKAFAGWHAIKLSSGTFTRNRALASCPRMSSDLARASLGLAGGHLLAPLSAALRECACS